MTVQTYPVELNAVDISPYRHGNTGIDYATTLDSGSDGPHVMLSALVHGNELCGAHALDYLLREGVRPVRGRLTFVFMNIAAYARFDPANPVASRFVDEDFNRVWSPEVLDGPRDSVELRRAREVRPLVDSVDLLLDIHSMHHPAPPSMLAGPLEKGRRIALEVGTPEHVICDAGHAAGTRLRDYGDFADPESDRNALLVECGQHWSRRTARVAVEVALRFLACTGAVAREWIERRQRETGSLVQRIIEVTEPVTVETDRFWFAEPYEGMEVIPEAGTVIGWDGERAVRTPYPECVLIMPSRRLRRGESAVRFGRYVTRVGAPRADATVSGRPHPILGHRKVSFDEKSHSTRGRSPMTIKVGDNVPSVALAHMTESGPGAVTSDELFGDRKVVMFAVPGAFTPVCSAAHLPGFVANADKIKAKGVDDIVCISVNDAFVMDAWGKAQNAEAIHMVADGSGAFSRAVGLEFDLVSRGLGMRSRRYAMVVENGVVTHLLLDDGPALEKSGAESVLDLL